MNTQYREGYHKFHKYHSTLLHVRTTLSRWFSTSEREKQDMRDAIMINDLLVILQSKTILNPEYTILNA